MPAPRPSTYLNWIPSNNPAFIQQPSGGQLASGWTYAEAPPFRYMNWIHNLDDQWIQYLDQALTGFISGGAVSIGAQPVVLTTTGSINSGSRTLTAASTTGVLQGHIVSGTGISPGTFITDISGLTVTMSKPATSTQLNEPITFSHHYAVGANIQAQLDELDARATESNYSDIVTVNPAVTPTVTLDELANNRKIYHVRSSLGALSIQLPAPVPGFLFYVKDVDGSFGTNFTTLLRTSGGQKIEGVTANYQLFSALGAYTVWSDGTDWFVSTGFSTFGDGAMRNMTARTAFIDSLAGNDSALFYLINNVNKWYAFAKNSNGNYVIQNAVTGRLTFMIDPSDVAYIRGGALIIDNSTGGNAVLRFENAGVATWDVYNENATGDYAIGYVPGSVVNFRIKVGTGFASVNATAASAGVNFEDSAVLKWQTYNDHATGNYTIRYAPGGTFPFFMDTSGNGVFLGALDAGNGRVSVNATAADSYFELRDSNAVKWRMLNDNATGMYKLNYFPGGTSPFTAGTTGFTTLGLAAAQQAIRGALVQPDFAYTAPAINGSAALGTNVPGIIVDPVADVSIVVSLPASGTLSNGQEAWVKYGTVNGSAGSAVVLLAGSGTSLETPISLTAGQAVTLVYRAASAVWYVKSRA